MFFFCYVPFHLTAPFHTFPRGPESGDVLVHVTVIIFFTRDKDMDSRDCLLPQHSGPISDIVWGQKKNENEFSQKQSKPIHTLTAKVVLCTPETRADARINPEVRENRAVFRQHLLD